MRAITSLGLKEARTSSRRAQAAQEGVSKEEAAKIKEQVEAAGGQVDIK